MQNTNQYPNIKVLGLGQDGKQIVNNMLSKGLNNLSFIVSDNDDIEAFNKEIKDAKMLIIIANIADKSIYNNLATISSNLDCLTLGLFTKPSTFEGIEAIEEVKANLDSLLVISNDNDESNLALVEYVKIIANLFKPGLINVDLEDLKSVLKGHTKAYINSYTSKGENRAIEAAKAVSSSNLLGLSIADTSKVIVNITCNEHITLEESEIVIKELRSKCAKDTPFIYSMTIDSTLNDEFIVNIIAA